jgi:hypothetical protein
VSAAHKLNIAVIVGIGTLIDALALARQNNIKLDRIYHGTVRFDPLEDNFIKEVCAHFNVEYRGHAHIAIWAKQNIVQHSDIRDLINNVDTMIAMYRMRSACGEMDIQLIEVINPMRVLGILDGLCVDADKKGSVPAHGSDKVFGDRVYVDENKLALYREHLSWFRPMKILKKNNLQAIKQHLISQKTLQSAISKFKSFVSRGNYSLLLTIYEQHALHLTLEESAIFYARAAKRILQSSECLYIKLHPRDTWAKRILLKELLFDHNDRIAISHLGAETLFPVEMLTAEFPPDKAYLVSSTSVVDFVLRDIPVYEIRSSCYQQGARINSVLDLKFEELAIETNDFFGHDAKSLLAFRTYMANLGNGRRIIFGAGKFGRRFLSYLLSQVGKKVPSPDAFLDDNEAGNYFEQWTIKSTKSFRFKKNDTIFLATDSQQEVMRSQLERIGYKGRIVGLC